MPAPYLTQLPKTKSAEEFELMCCDVLQKRYNTRFQLYGRSGQPQNGIDLYAPSPQSNGLYIVAQCKNYLGDSKPSALISKIQSDITSVKQQSNLHVQILLIMTSFNRDIMIQNTIIEQQETCPFELESMFWEDIQSYILSDQTLLAKYYPFNMSSENLVSLFNLAFIGIQFSYLISLLLGDRGETNRFCELLQNGAAWIKNDLTRQRFTNFLNGVYQFVNGDLPFDTSFSYKHSDEYCWCIEIEKIVSSAGDSLDPMPRTLFLIGTHLGHCSKVLGMNDTAILPPSEMDILIERCHSYGFTNEQIQNIEQILKPVLLSPPDPTALPSESYSYIRKRIAAPDRAYEYIRNLLMRI